MNKKFFKNKKNILLLLLLLLAIIILFIRIFYHEKKDNITIVTSSSKFYTVSNCVDRFFNYLYSEDVDNIILILDNSYLKKNKINENNVFTKISKLNINSNFEAKKMYQEIVSKNKIKYYVKGYIIPNDMSYNYNNKKIYYIIVYIDTKNDTYSIEPYNGNIFIKGDNNEKK